MRFFNEPLVDDPHPKYPCGICSKLVGQRMKAVYTEVVYTEVGIDMVNTLNCF